MDMFHSAAILSLCGLLLSTAAVTDEPPALSNQTERHRLELGSPLIRNYTPKEYNSSPQTWTAVQDRRGMMYFGTNNDILEFDGQNWRKIELTTFGVDGMAIGPDQVIYVGLTNDLGYLSSTSDGEMKFVSLLEKLPETERAALGRIWSTLATSHGIYFSTHLKTYRWFNGRFQIIKTPKCRVYLAHNQLYLVAPEQGVLMLVDGELIPIPFFDRFVKPKLGRITPMPWVDDQVLLLANNHGGFVHDTPRFLKHRDGAYSESFISQLTTELEPYLKTFRTTNGVKISETRFAVSTQSGGILIFDHQGKLIQVINRHNGLVDDIVYRLFVDRDGNLWACSNNGLSYILVNSPLSVFDKRNGVESAVISLARFNQQLYFGTFTGLFRLPPNPFDPQTPQRNMYPLASPAMESFALTRHREILLGASYGDVLHIEGDSATRVWSAEQYVYSFGQSKRFPHIVFVGTEKGLFALKIGVEKKEDDTKVTASPIKNDGLNSITGEFFIIQSDADGGIWASARASKLVHITWSGPRVKDLTIRRYGTEHGLPDDLGNNAYFVNSQILVGTKEGIYRISESAKTKTDSPLNFVPDPTYNAHYTDTKSSVFRIMADKTGNVWVAGEDERGITVAYRETDGSIRWADNRFHAISGMTGSWFCDDDNTIWFGTDDGLFRYDPTIQKDYQSSYHTLIRRVIAGKNRILYHGTNFDSGSQTGKGYTRVAFIQAPQLMPTLAYAENAVTFDYAATFFELTENTRFQYQLEGFDPDWSDWSKETKKQYTNLPEGEYQFVVQAKNTFGHPSKPARYRFSILPPWYRTIWAYLIYFVIGGIGFGFSLRLYTWRLLAAKRKLQRIVKERTFEIEMQKEEIQAQADALELTNQQVTAQRDQIIEQRDQIKNVNDALWGEMQLAKKIQTVLVPAAPEIEGYQISSHMEPTDDVGGDYYDVINMGDRDWIIIGDVSGHGVPAGLVMMMVQTAMHSVLTTLPGASPAEILVNVNQTIFQNIRRLGEHKYMTITAFCVQPDGTMIFSGLHQDILVYRAAKKTVEAIHTDGIWIGVTEVIEHMLEVDQLTLAPGDALLLFTDGIVEAKDQQGNMFSNEKLMTLFQTAGHLPVEEIKIQILDALVGYKCADDVTLLVLKRNWVQKTASTQPLQME